MSTESPPCIYRAFETVNPAVCDKLARMSIRDFLKFWDPSELNEEGKQETAKTQYGIITRYCQAQQSANYNLERNYTYASGMTQGRIFVENMGLQRIFNQFRGCLCDGLYYDLDMINAHPTLLLYICQQNGIQAPTLAEYVSNRDLHLQELIIDDGIDRDTAKRLFLTAINKTHPTSKIKKTPIRNAFFLRFDNEIHTIQHQLITKFPEDVSRLVRHNYKAKANLGGCLTNMLMTALENTILQQVITLLNNMNIVPDVPMFDGLMVRSNSLALPLPELITILNHITRDYGIHWSHKAHNTSLKTQILALTESNKLSYIGNDIIDVTKYVWTQIFQGRIISCAGCLYFKSFTDHLYITDERTIRSVIQNYIADQDLYIAYENESPEKLTRVYQNLKNATEHIISLALDTKNAESNFLDSLFTKTIRKLNFNNGIYDFNTMTFINDPAKVEGFFKIKYDYTDIRNPEVIQQVYDRIINPIFGIKNETDPEQVRIKSQLRDCILYRLARSVAGFYEDKNWFMLEGLRNSGKGVLFGLLDTTIGEYMTSCDSRNFIFKGQASGTDSAKENMFLFGLQLHRIINIQEFGIMPGKQPFINGSIIKSICSGGDLIETRQHYGMPIRMRVQATLIFAANEYPEFSPANTLETCTVWAMNGKFVKPDDEPIPGYMNYPCDDSIKDFIKYPAVGQAFLHILMDALAFPPARRQYPAEVRAENISANDQLSSNATLDAIRTVFQFTDDPGHVISNTSIKTALAERGIVIGKMILAKQLKALGGVPYMYPSNERGYSKIALI